MSRKSAQLLKHFIYIQWESLCDPETFSLKFPLETMQTLDTAAREAGNGQQRMYNPTNMKPPRHYTFLTEFKPGKKHKTHKTQEGRSQLVGSGR